MRGARPAATSAVVDRVVGAGDLAPGRAPSQREALQALRRLVHGGGQAAVAALQGEVRRLALERQAQREELGQLVARQHGHARAAVGLDAHEALDLQLAQGGAQRVAGDLVGLDQLALDQPLAGLEVAVEDALAQDGRQLVDGRCAPQGGGVHAGTAATAEPAAHGRREHEQARRARAARRRRPRPRDARRGRRHRARDAVSGSARTSVAVSPLDRRRRPREKST